MPSKGESALSREAVQESLSTLDAIVQDLTDTYTRPAHAGRLEQISQHVAGLKAMIEQLPDEEDREADYGRRLLAVHDAGFFNPDNPDHTKNFPHDAVPRLKHELGQREAAAAATMPAGSES